MKTRETFEKIRNRKKEYFTLRVKMVLAVQVVLFFCTLLAWGFDLLIKKLFPLWRFPFILEFVIVSMIVGSLLTAVAAKAFIDPMKKLRIAMDKVADGDFSVRLEPDETKSGEVKELYAGFNLMTHELNSTELLQSDFVSNVSHEFKTPISALEGYATLLQDEGITEEERREYVEKILLNTKRLSGLAGNILLLSKLENPVSEPPKRMYRLDEQIRQSILMLENEWVSKDIEFDVEMEDTEYYGYEGLMHHVWYNLISNAVKFNPCGGNVTIRLKKQEDGVIFTIADKGEGIPEESKKRIFDKFYQCDTSHKQDGNGLGLALVKKIVTRSSGTVAVENIQGGGCRFTVVLKNAKKDNLKNIYNPNVE